MLLTQSSSCFIKHICGRLLHSTSSFLFVPSIVVRRKDHDLFGGNMSVIMVFILRLFLVNLLVVFMMSLAIPFSWFQFILLVLQSMIINDVVCGKEISCTLHKTLSTWSPPMPKLTASSKWSLQTRLYLLNPVNWCSRNL